MTSENLPSICALENNQELTNECLKSTIKRALVEEFLEGNERPCNKSDFVETRMNREKITSEIKTLIKDYVENSLHNQDIETNLLALILILCGQNTNVHPWNTEVTVKNCKAILSETLTFLNCKEASEIISKNCKINLLKVLFQMLCPELTALTWKNFPAAVASYIWILKMIEQPLLSQYLQFVLPPALLMTDDFVTENKINGIKCLNHIIQNVTIAELQFCGHGNVIYSVLMPLLRLRESEIIHSLMSPLICLTTKLEFDLGRKDIKKVITWSKFDDILEIYLENMELEQQIDLRNCYISNLKLLVEASGLGIVKWSKRLLRIFRDYIQTASKYNDEKTINLCLKAIEKYIRLSSESTLLYAENLLVTLMLALDYISKFSSKLQNESKEITVTCTEILLKSLSKSERDQLEQIFKEKFSYNFNFES